MNEEDIVEMAGVLTIAVHISRITLQIFILYGSKPLEEMEEALFCTNSSKNFCNFFVIFQHYTIQMISVLLFSSDRSVNIRSLYVASIQKNPILKR